MVTDKNKCGKCPGFFLFQSSQENRAGNMEGEWCLLNRHGDASDGEAVRLQVSSLRAPGALRPGRESGRRPENCPSDPGRQRTMVL